MGDRTRFVLLLAVLLACASQGAQAQSGINLVGDNIAARIDKVFAAYARQDCPGCALGIARDGKVIYTHGYGMANLEYSVPITPESIFEAGSVSKQFTTGAIQILARRGKLSLEDDIRKYLPPVPDFGPKITIRNLLSHTSGLRDQWELLTLQGRPPGSAVHTLQEILYLVSRQRELNFPPGQEYLYSNTGFSLLAMIVGKASGVPLAEFSTKEIFQPLGMASTQWRDDYTRIVKGRATAYGTASDRQYHTNMSFTNVYGNGGLLSTVGDLLIWNENFENPRVIGKEGLEQMQTPSRLNDGTAITYGLGIDVMQYRGLREINHSGSTAGYRAFLTRFPDQHLSIALLCNLGSINPTGLGHQIADIFLEKDLKEAAKPVRVDVPVAQVQRCAGVYRNLLMDSVLRLNFTEGKLIVAGGQGGELVPVGRDRFQAANGGQFIFTFSKPVRLEVKSGEQRGAQYVAVDTFAPTAEQMPEYMGSYYSSELDVTFAIEMRDGRLILGRRLQPDAALTPVYQDAFSAVGAIVRFTRAASGRIDGMRVSTGRMLHLQLVRRPEK